jgi:hypothetical protein
MYTILERRIGLAIKQIKEEQLGMTIGKSNNILRKNVMFHLAKKCGMDTCYQCGNKIDNIDEFTIEHKVPWLHNENPIGTFLNMDNIAFSHAGCNSRAARRPIVK